MVTERYLINFYSIDEKCFTKDTIMDLWRAAASKECNHGGCYIDAVVEEADLIYNMNSSCTNGKTIRLTTTRNPAFTDSSTQYYDAIRKIIFEVKHKLDHPPVSISINTTNFFFFDSV